MAEVKRKHLHTRQIDVQGFLRDDGLWEVEAELRDTKAYPFTLVDRGLIPVGGYLHRMVFVLTVDDRLRIQGARTEMRDTPYPDCCGAEKRYDELIGLQIKSGWLEEAKERIGRQQGCTHLTELLPVLATNAFQTIRGYQINQDNNYETIKASKDFILDSCHGFRDGGFAQQTFWPEEGQES